MSGNDKIRERVKRLIDDRGVDMATVSKAIGKNHAYIQQYLTRGVPADLSYKTAVAMADYFGCDLSMFGMKTSAGNPSNDTRKNRHPLQSIRRLVGLNTAQFARALGEAETAIQSIEDGDTPLSEKMMLRICRTFQIEPEDLAEYAPSLSPDERVMLLRIRGLTPTQRREMEKLLRKFDKERA